MGERSGHGLQLISSFGNEEFLEHVEIKKDVFALARGC